MTSEERFSIGITVVVGLAGVLLALRKNGASNSSITNGGPVNISSAAPPYLNYNLPASARSDMPTLPSIGSFGGPGSGSGSSCGSCSGCNTSGAQCGSSALATSPSSWDYTGFGQYAANIASAF